VINPPGVAILGLSALREHPRRGDGDAIDWRAILSLSLSCDHRAVDGATAAPTSAGSSSSSSCRSSFCSRSSRCAASRSR
jgi:hypothetical protein